VTDAPKALLLDIPERLETANVTLAAARADSVDTMVF
jgi:hypothetical protein